MLDNNLCMEEKGGNPEIVRESQRRRCSDVELVDEVIRLDKVWRQLQFELDGLKNEFNKTNKQIASLKIVGASSTINFLVRWRYNYASGLIATTEENRELIAKKEAEVQEAVVAGKSKIFVFKG